MPHMRAGEHIHVLVVDDSAVMRQVMISVLGRESGITVDVAAHPLIARTKMERHRPDVIVLDLEMPHVDGLTFLQRIMATDPIPVLVCSALARGGADSVIRALEYGAVDVVQKPASGIQDFLYEVGKRHPFATLRDWFACLYQVLLGAQEGPRFGGFVALYGIPGTIGLIETALAREAPAPEAPAA